MGGGGSAWFHLPIADCGFLSTLKRCGCVDQEKQMDGGELRILFQIQNFVLVFLDDSWHGRVGRMRCQIYESHYQKSGNASRCRESPKKNQNKVLYLNFQPIIIF